MSRRFAEHTRRSTRDLRGIWDFAFLGERDADSLRVETIAFDDRMLVPGCFDATPRYAGRRGLAAYRTRIFSTGKGRARLVVDGAHHHATFLLDGARFARHAGGFTRFAVDLPPAERGEHELVLGVAIWQLADCRTSERIQNALGRPRGYNNKGLFDEYRRPKLATRAVSKHFLR